MGLSYNGTIVFYNADTKIGQIKRHDGQLFWFNDKDIKGDPNLRINDLVIFKNLELTLPSKQSVAYSVRKIKVVHINKELEDELKPEDVLNYKKDLELATIKMLGQICVNKLNTLDFVFSKITPTELVNMEYPKLSTEDKESIVIEIEDIYDEKYTMFNNGKPMKMREEYTN